MNSIADQYFSSVLEYLKQHGVSYKEALNAIDCSDLLLDNLLQLPSRIALDRYNALLKYAKETLNDRLFGFKLGQDIRTADFGVLGYLIESSENLSHAINALLSYDSLVADIGYAEFIQQPEGAIIRWTPHSRCNEQVILRNMTAWVSVIRQLLSDELSPTKVSFQHLWQKNDLVVLSNWFKCPVVSHSQYNQIEFPSAYLHLPFRTENAQINRALKQVSEQQLSHLAHQKTCKEQVINRLLSFDDLQGCNLQVISASFNISSRSLQRKLKQEQCNFITLLDDERKRRVQLFMGIESWGNIASKLGFNEQSSFNRAFKRWYGCNPSKYLKKTTEYT